MTSRQDNRTTGLLSTLHVFKWFIEKGWGRDDRWHHNARHITSLFCWNCNIWGTFHLLVKISGISGSAVNGTRFVGSSHWKIPWKSGKSKKVGLFSRVEFLNGILCSIYTFLIVCTSSRSMVGTTTYQGFRPNGTTFFQLEILLFFPPKFPGFFP